MLDRPVCIPDRPEVAIARATALLSLHRHGVLTRQDLSELAGAGEPIEPIAAHHEVYARHQPQFEATFDALRPISAALNT